MKSANQTEEAFFTYRGFNHFRFISKWVLCLSFQKMTKWTDVWLSSYFSSSNEQTIKAANSVITIFEVFCKRVNNILRFIGRYGNPCIGGLKR
jgi:hypothetical protein